MAGDLVRQKALSGLDPEQLVMALGEPDEKSEGSWSYGLYRGIRLTYQGTAHRLRVHFGGDGRVREATVEEKTGMGCLGVHFALTEAEVDHLRSLSDEQARLEHVIEDIESTYFHEKTDFVAESDKAWDAMHRALADGGLTWGGGEYPLNHVVLAGELLYTESDYIMSLKSPEQVRDIAAALLELTESDFRRRYFAIDPDSYGSPVDEQDFGYTWDWFQNVCRLYNQAATEGRYVLFTASQ